MEVPPDDGRPYRAGRPPNRPHSSASVVPQGKIKEPDMVNPCRGEKGFVYPFKLKPEERYPIKDPRSYTEFEQRYPPDRFGEEASDNARVWKLYRDRATERDEDQIRGWNQTLDVILIFAGLFSAVATAFIIEAYKQLQPDYTRIMAKAFLASLNGTTSAELANLSQFSRPPLARCVNMLWFISLTYALVAALLAILAKQWLGVYTSRMHRHISSHRRWAWRHLFYHTGLERWGIDPLVSTTPVLLHMSLLLFLVGLVIFLTDVDWVIAGLILVATAYVVVFYTVVTIAPLWFKDCPTELPTLNQYRYLFGFLHTNLRSVLLSIRKSVDRQRGIQSWNETKTVFRSWDPPPTFDEKSLLEEAGAGHRDAMALRWMVTTLPAMEEIEVALDAVGSLNPLEQRGEFHKDSLNGVESDDLVDPLVVAATARFQRLCEFDAGSDAAVVARCIRTLLALGVKKDQGLKLPPRSNSAAQHLLDRWAEVPTHDLGLLCETFSDHSDCYKSSKARKVVRAWTDDAGPVAGETPFLPSSITLSFSSRKTDNIKLTNSTALIYSTLSASVASLASDPVGRCAALTMLHDAAFFSRRDSVYIKPAKACSDVFTPQQLHFRAMSTIVGLLKFPPFDRVGWLLHHLDTTSKLQQFSPIAATGDVRRILFANFARLVSTFPGVETLTLEHMSYARDILDMAPHLKPEGDEVVKKLHKLVEDYLCHLTAWSEDAGKMTRRLLELRAKLPTHIDGVIKFTTRLSELSHDNIFPASEVVLRDSLVNLLQPGTQGESSVWRTLCDTLLCHDVAKHAIPLTSTLALLLITLKRRFSEDPRLVEEFFRDDILHKLMSSTRFKGKDSSHLAQQARVLSPEWWNDTKRKMNPPSYPQDNFIKEVEARHECCQTCKFDILWWGEAAQIAISGQENASTSPLARAHRRARGAIIGGTWRERSAGISDAEAHELPVITVLPPVEPHVSHTSLARASVTSVHDGLV